MPIDGVTSKWYPIRVRGFDRRYLVFQPAGRDAAAIPTIVDLHGSGSWPEEYGAITAAETSAALGAVVVVPQAGIPFRMLSVWPEGFAWNVPGSPLPGESDARDEPDDVAFVHALITRIVERHGVDPGRVHLRGYSGGARLASHLMAASCDRLSSVCCVGGVRFVEPSAGRKPPLLAVHGARDAVNPYGGGSGPRWSSSVEAVVRDWAAALGCEPAADYRSISERVREARYVDRDGFAAVRLVTVGDAGHSWPGTRHGDHLEQFGPSGSWHVSQAHWHFISDIDDRRERRG